MKTNFTTLKKNRFLLPILISVIFLSCEKKREAQKSTTKTTAQKSDGHINLFEKLPESTTGINFSNNLKEDVATIENLFDFDYFYNGGGVGIADLNNDGLPDIFFTGNQVENKLYLNKGNLSFEDISAKANINNGKVWSNGVTFVDINNDGFLDIYVSQGGPKQSRDRKNLLFINQQDLTFTEEAETYGLADTGIGTQSVFFDLDNDGDLDCYVSNENELYGNGPTTFFKYMQIPKNLYRSSGHLYENTNGKFTDITKKAGVLLPSFGLGVAVSDINNDGWLDIYVANDYYIADRLFINNKNGTFTDKIKTYTQQVSFYGMGVDIADTNNDGLQDIFVLDMASSDHVRSKTLMASMDVERFSLLTDRFKMPNQYMFNSLQLNAGNNNFSNIAHFAGIAKTDWSWAGLLTDLDLDGNKDIFVTNGYRRYALDNDSQIQIRKMRQAYRGNVPIAIKRRLYEALPSEKLPNIVYHNNGPLSYKNTSATWGLGHPSFSNGAAYADLDGDGDVELVVNNIDETAFVYKNNSAERGLGNFVTVTARGETSEGFAKISAFVNGEVQFFELKRVKGYLSSMPATCTIGLGPASKIDSLRVQWPNGKTELKRNVGANSQITFHQKDARGTIAENAEKTIFKPVADKLGIDFSHKENNYNDFEKEVLLLYKQSTLGPFIAKGDVNNDGLEDFYIGGAAGQAGKLYRNTGNGFTEKKSTTFNADAAHEDMQAVFFDLEGDGDSDLYVMSGGNEFEKGSKKYTDRLYVNDGKGNYTKKTDAAIAAMALPGMSVAALDYDKDGDTDLVLGNRIAPQQYPTGAASAILKNEGSSFTNATNTVAPSFETFGMVNKVIATDFDNDGWEDFIAVGEWAAIGLFKNEKGKFKNISIEKGSGSEKGLWFSVTETDVNGDGLKDYVLGNMGANVKFKASQQLPLKLYGNDFDDNGTYDIVLGSQYNGKEVPARGRECSSQQMPFITQKFETYNAFANASLRDIYGERLDAGFTGEITTLKSKLLLNKGGGSFQFIDLPAAAQLFPLLGAVSIDYDTDGDLDLVLCGNIYNTEVETPRLDMATGLVLKNDAGVYRAVPYKNAGLYILGDSKSLEVFKTGSKVTLIAGINNGRPAVFQRDE